VRGGSATRGSGKNGAMSVGGAYRVVLSELASVGLDPVAVCTAAGVDPRVLHDDAVPLGLDELTRALERAEAIASDPLLGLHMAQRARGRGVLSYLARSQATVGEGLESFRRFAGTRWDDPNAIRLEQRAARTFVGFHLAAGLPRHALEYVVARTAISLRQSAAPAAEATFVHPPGGPAKEYERILRCPIRFRQPGTTLALRTRDLARPLRAANPDAAAALEAALDRPATPATPTTTSRLSSAVEAAIARGDHVDRERLARGLGMSGKTLSRRLAVEERVFRDVVDAVRRDQAQKLVGDKGLELGEVAVRVGFADVAAFGKAFRRWFGVSPSAFRTRRAG
jgi:AraC-like DNA-binding protein